MALPQALFALRAGDAIVPSCVPPTLSDENIEFATLTWILMMRPTANRVRDRVTHMTHDAAPLASLLPTFPLRPENHQTRKISRSRGILVHSEKKQIALQKWPELSLLSPKKPHETRYDSFYFPTGQTVHSPTYSIKVKAAQNLWNTQCVSISLPSLRH